MNRSRALTRVLASTVLVVTAVAPVSGQAQRATGAPPAELRAPRHAQPQVPAEAGRGDTVAAGREAARATGAGWTIQPPPTRLVLLKDRRTSFLVTVADTSARVLRLAQSTLQDERTAALLGVERMRLCDARFRVCSDSVRVPGSVSRGVGLEVASSFSTSGTFSGNIFLTADGRGEWAAFQLTVLSTTWWRRLLGLALIALGIGVSVLLTAVVRNRILRAEALLPAARLRERVEQLRGRVKEAAALTQVTLEKTDKRLAELAAGLTAGTLEGAGLIPPLIPRPFRAAPADADAYKQRLQNNADALAAVAIVVQAASDPRLRTTAGSAPTEPRRRALEALDQTGATVQTVDTARQEVSRIFSHLDADEGRPKPAAAAAVFPAAPTETQTLLMELRRFSAFAWLLWAVITAAAGWAVLIGPDLAFGAGVDYVYAFLWGLGIQVTGQQLQQLTPAGIRDQLELKLPKVES